MEEVEEISKDLYKEIPIETLVLNLENEFKRKNPNLFFFHNLKGWLVKPDYKRKQQQINDGLIETVKRLSFLSFLPYAYSLRWFHLNSLAGELCYYEDEDQKNLRGKILIREIKRIQYSTVSDAPRYSLDLVSHDTYYTIGCKSYREMITWALAIILELREVYSQPCKNYIVLN
jgi:hypothetical protein